jgi:hypothetical protein
MIWRTRSGAKGSYPDADFFFGTTAFMAFPVFRDARAAVARAAAIFALLRFNDCDPFNRTPFAGWAPSCRPLRLG